LNNILFCFGLTFFSPKDNHVYVITTILPSQIM